jgi:hypothetical protein
MVYMVSHGGRILGRQALQTQGLTDHVGKITSLHLAALLGRYAPGLVVGVCRASGLSLV